MTRTPAPDRRPVGLTVAGSDSGGGAGIQADLKTMEAHGAFATSAITAVTAQNTRGVESSHVLPIEEIRRQIEAVRADFDVGAAKTGMLATAPVVELVATVAAEAAFPVVVDPVMVAASGDRLLDPDAEEAYDDLIAAATVVTPNADEAAVLTGIEPTDAESMESVGERLLETGAEAVLVKGGHVPGEQIIDVLITDDARHHFEHPRIDTAATHGSGCTLSAAIAARLAAGEPLLEAVRGAIEFMGRAVRYPLAVGGGPGSVHHLVGIRDRAARQPTQEAVESIVERLVEANVAGLVPEVGMNVVGATPYAEAVADVAAVEGRITRIVGGIKPNRGVRFGASSHVARFLLAAREFDPGLRFAVNCRFDRAVEDALETLDGPVAAFDRDAEPEPVQETEGETMGWAAGRAFDDAPTTPAAVIDRGGVGKEPIARVLGRDAESIVERTLAVHRHLA